MFHARLFLEANQSRATKYFPWIILSIYCSINSSSGSVVLQCSAHPSPNNVTYAMYLLYT